MSKKEPSLWERIRTEPLLSSLIFLLVLLTGLLVSVMFCETCKEWVGERLGLHTKNKILTFLGIGMGGVLLALQALMSYKRAKALEDTANAQAEAAKAQAKATEEQAKANEKTEQGQRQERLKNAIEHLGHASDSVRLGGAYELFHLAEDTKDLRQTVLDILCAHIRRTTGEDEYRRKYPSKPSEEIQSLLTLLFVQEYEVFKGCRVNLQGSWLNGANFERACLVKAVLTKTYLKKAQLVGARLQEANLVEAHLQGADIVEASLQKARLRKARLQDAKLYWAHLQGAWFSKADLQGADFYEAYLQDTNFSEAHLQGANLSEAYLQDAGFPGADLQGADFSNAHLQGTSFSEAGLQGADFSRAHLQGAYLFGAHLQASRLWEARLGGVNDKERSLSDNGFARRMKLSIGKEIDLFSAIFTGGLSQEDLDSIVKGLSDEKAKELRTKLEPHIDQPISHELPKNSGAITEPYTAEEAEQWIAEYNEAMSEVPKSSNN